MSMKPVSNIRFTAENPPIDPERQQEVNGMINDLEAALQHLEDSRDYYEYLGLDEQARIESMKVRIEGEIALLDTYLKTGEWPTAEEMMGGDLWQRLPEMEAGWNGTLSYMSHESEDFLDYEARVIEGVLKEVITVPGAANASVGFVIKDEEGVESVRAKTVGNDIWYTVTYKEETGKEPEVYIVKDGAIRNMQLFISAEANTTGVKIYTHEVVRSNGQGMIIVGGKGSDIISGSGGTDTIVGWEGNDKLFGMGGVDRIFGDGVRKDADGALLAINDETGGNDHIDGGAGMDEIHGGGGAEDVVVDDADFPDVVSPDVEERTDIKGEIAAADRDALIAGLTASSDGWTVSRDDTTGEIVVAKADDYKNGDNTVGLNIPAGYEMVTVESDGDDAVATLVKMAENEDGELEPSYIKVRIKDVTEAGSQSNIIINAPHGGALIDCRGFNAASNKVVVNGNRGSDAIFGARTNLDDLPIIGENIHGSGNIVSRGERQAIIEQFTAEDENGNPLDECTWGGDHWTGRAQEGGNGEIVLALNGEEDGLDLVFEAPEVLGDVDGVYYEADGDDLIVYIIDVKDAETGDFEMVKMRIAGGRGKVDSIKIKKGEAFFDAKLMGTVTINSGDGRDFISGNLGSTVAWGAGDKDSVNKAWGGTAWSESPAQPAPAQPSLVDSDGDLFPDELEEEAGTDPEDPDSKPQLEQPEDV